jgi:hypothetical protein
MDIDHDKALAALAQLESEKDRRLQAKIDSGEAVLWSGAPAVIVLGDEEVASLPTTTSDGRPFYYDGNVVTAVVTPIPKKEEYKYSSPQVQASSEEGARPSDGVEAASGPSISCSRPTYVKVIIRNGGEDDPGQISEAWYTIEDGAVVLRDANDKHITSRALLNGEDPAVLARILLREAEAPKEFQRPLSYPKLGLA